MAATYKDNGGSVNGSNKVFTYDFPVLQTEDIKVALNGVTQATTKYTASLSPANITFNNTSVDSSVQESDGSPKSGVTVRVYRETTVGKASGDEDPKAVFASGSSIRAGDLNANVEQALFGIHELQEQQVQTESIADGAVNSAKIIDGSIVNADVNASAAIAGTKVSPAFGSQNISTSGTLAAGATTVTGNITVSGTVDGRDLQTDGTKLDGIAVSANNYSHPTSAGNKHIPSGGSSGQVLKYDSSGTAVWAADTNTTYSVGDGGLTQNNFTNTLKTKLDGIETAATADQTAAEIKTLLNSNGIVNAQVDASAAIAGTKVSPDFGSQNIDTTGNILLDSDSNKLKIGDDEDLEIYHNGSGSYVDNTGTGQLFIRSDGGVSLMSETSPSQNYVVCTDGGAVTLYYNAAEKIRTGTNGVIVTGNLDLNGNLDVSGSLTIPDDSISAAKIGTFNLADLSNVHNATPSDGQVLKWINANSRWEPAVDAGASGATLGDGDYGDITVSASGSTFTIDNSVVTTVKINDDAVTADKLANSINTEIAANTAKTTNATHSGEVTGATALTIADDVVDEANLKVDNTPTNDYVLTAKSSAAGGLTWAAAASGVGGATGVDFNDGVKARFGTGNDLELYHSGSHAIIKNDTGNLYLYAKGTGNELGAAIYPDGAVELYYDNVKKLQTVANGVHIVGNSYHIDNEKSIYGGGDDLQIYHDGTDNILFSDAPDLFIKTTSDETCARFGRNGAVDLYYDNSKKFQTDTAGVRVLGAEGGDAELHLYADEGDDNPDCWKFNASEDASRSRWMNKNSGSWETSIECNGDNNVELYYDGSKKFATTSGGVHVYNALNTSGAIGIGNASNITLEDGGEAVFGNSSDLIIKHTSTNSLIKHNGGGDLYIDSYNKDIYLRTGDGSSGVTTAIDCQNNGSVNFYHAGSLRAFTSSNGFQVYKGSSDDTEFRIVNTQNTTAGATNTILSEHDGRTTAKIVFGRNNDANDFSAAAATTQGDIQFWTTNSGSLSKKGTFRNAGGLCFGTDTANANALNDYEQGAFTPILRKSGDTTGQVSGTGAYTKIGNVVHAKICFANKACSNIPNGAVAEIQGLPFNAHHGTHTDEMAISGPMVEMGIAQRNGGIFRTTTATSYLRAYYMNNNSTWSVWYVDDFNNSGVYLIFGITYLTT